MDRLSLALRETYWQRAITPVIVEAQAGRFQQVRDQVRQLVPLDKLQPRFETFLPRLMPAIEFPISKWKEIPTFNMVATVLTPSLIEEVAQLPGVMMLYPDGLRWAVSTVPSEGVFKDYQGKAFTSTYWTKRMLGLDRANSKGFTGRGITTAVIDTGARKSHPMLYRVVVRTAMAEKGGSGTDSNGHGSWCNATVGGVKDIDPRYRVPVEGMAPECTLVSIQALGFIVGMGTESDILQAMEMAGNLGAKVVSMSLGSNDAPPDAENPEAKAVNQLTQKGVIVVVAAGNSGPKPGTVGSPGSCLNSLTVGSISPFTGAVSEFSSRGPTAEDGYIKPDVTAPGERIDSALEGLLDAMTDRSEPKFGSISGTSMACPHVSGLVTCMAQLYKERVGRELTVDEVKRMMLALGHPKDDSTGWGMLHWGLVEEWVEGEYGVKL